MTGQGTSERAIRDNYASIQRAMVTADTHTLDELLAENYTATHVTGYVQTKGEWLTQIKAGYFRYHAINDVDLTITIAGDTATLIAQSDVTVTIAGSRGTWRLASTFHYATTITGWRPTRSESTPVPRPWTR